MVGIGIRLLARVERQISAIKVASSATTRPSRTTAVG